MKFLKIENNKGYFIKDKNQPDKWFEIDQIEKTELMTLLDYAIEEDFEMDEFKEADIQHKAHQIIYKHLHEKFSLFLKNKSRFKDETERIYKDAIEKYK
jgi:hypothetical protein